MHTTKLVANTKRWGKAILVMLGLISILYWQVQIFEIIKMIGDRDAIAAFLQQFGVIGPVILFVILALQVFMAVIPGHAIMVAGGYIYGLFIGALITQFSTVIASQLAFLLTRKYGRPLVDRIAPANIIEHWNKLSQSQGALFFFFSFILPIFPNDLMCFIAGMSEITPRKFFLANFFGRLPCAIFVTLIGSHGFEMPLYFWVLIVLGMIFLSVFWKKISAKFEQCFQKNIPPLNCQC
jgi:uncharacterized membrane protein YdjX (TVP38/TMEM64 family)